MFRSSSLLILAVGLVVMAAMVLSEPNLQYHRISLASTQRKSQSLRHFWNTQETSKQALRKLDEDEESEEEIVEEDEEESEEEEEEEEEETPVEEPSEDEEESPEEEAPAESEDVEEEEEEEEEEEVFESEEEEVEEEEEETEEEASEEEELEEDQVVEIESEDEETDDEETSEDDGDEEEEEEESVEEEEVDIIEDETTQCEGESSVFFETHPAIMEAFGAVVNTEPYLEQLLTTNGTVVKLHLLFPQDPMAALGEACASAGGVWTMAGFEGLACVPSAEFLAVAGVVGDSPPLTVSFFGNCHADAAACHNVGSFNLLRNSLETFGLSCEASEEGDDDALPPPNADVPVMGDGDVSDILDLLEGESSAGMAGNRAAAWLATMGALGMAAVAVAF